MGQSVTAYNMLYFVPGQATTVAGTLDTNGFDTRVGNLDGTGTITNSGGSAATFIVKPNADTTFSGNIVDGASQLGLTLDGTSGKTLTLSGANTYTGDRRSMPASWP